MGTLNPYISRIQENIERVLNLIRLYDALEGAGPIGPVNSIDDDQFFVDEQTRNDILRASVVFTHASLEDFLRTFAAMLLPYATESVLDEIPIIGFEFYWKTGKDY